MVVCFAITAWTASSVCAVDTSHITDGLHLAGDIAGYIEQQDFSKTITKLASSASSYFGIVGTVLGFVFSFFDSGPSAELLAIEKLNKEIALRFDRVDHQFTAIKHEIDWKRVELQFSAYESKIHAVGQKYLDLTASTTKHDFTVRKNLFIGNYEQDFSNSADKIYDGVVNEHQVFNKALFDSAIDNFEWDRKKTQNFMLGVTKVLMFGATLELAYYHLKYPSQESYYRHQWQVKFEKFRQKMIATDHKLETQYGHQVSIDVDRYVINHAHSSNSDITNHLFDVINNKYFWRNWMVMVADHSTDPAKYAVHTCGGVTNNAHGKNVVVASVPKNKAHLTSIQQSHILHTKTYDTRHRHGGRRRDIQKRNLPTGVYTVSIHADVVLSHMSKSCDTYGSVGVVHKDLHPGWRSPSDHTFTRYDGHYYNLYAFG